MLRKYIIFYNKESPNLITITMFPICHKHKSISHLTFLVNIYVFIISLKPFICENFLSNSVHRITYKIRKNYSLISNSLGNMSYIRRILRYYQLKSMNRLSKEAQAISYYCRSIRLLLHNFHIWKVGNLISLVHNPKI